jgi:hypothetical protein
MRPRLLLIAGLLLCLAGCGGKQSQMQATNLQSWLAKQQFSTWETFYGPNGQQPRKPDGFTLGSRQIFAGIGCTPKDLSQIEPLFGYRKSQRALPSPLTFALQRGGETQELAELDRQRLRRIDHTAIIVGSSEDKSVKVTLVDFAPTAPENNCLIRLVTVENRGESARFSLLFASMLADLKSLDSHTLLANGKLGIYSDHALRFAVREDNQTEIKLKLGRIGKGQSRFAALLFVPAKYEPQVVKGLEQSKKLLAQPVPTLEATRQEWETWRKQIKTPAGDPRREDLVDSLLCLIRSHIGFSAIHTGSLRYAHTRAWVRDNYWVQRALLEAGLKKEARLNLNFFFAAWQKSGLASYYDIAGKRGYGYGNLQVELPHYYVLMVKDAETWAGVDGRRYWPMVKDCLDHSRLAPNGLQPVNGDETWLLAANINPSDYALDNSLLFVASHEYGANLARRVGDAKAAEKYAALAKQARRAMELWFIDPRQSRFAADCSGEQLAKKQLDEFPIAGALARPVVLGIYPTTDPRIRAGLLEAWEDLNYSEGVRAYARSDISDGGTPGYLLYAASEAGFGFADVLAERVIKNFCSATGNLWELQSAREPQWGMEKRRLWDSAVLSMGLLHQSKFPKKTAPSPVYQAAAPLSRLLDTSPQLILVEHNSAAPARELATQLARYYGAPMIVMPWAGEFPDKNNYIFISPTAPPRSATGKPMASFAGDNYRGTSFDVGGGQTQTIIWVKNQGEVFSDLRGLEYDLFRSAIPRRKPTYYPKSDLTVAQEIGEKPQGNLAVTVSCDKAIAIACGEKTAQEQQAEFALNLDNPQKPGRGSLQISAQIENEKILALTVTTNSGGAAKATVRVAFPPGWWLVEASGLQAGWNRLSDPIDEIQRPDGNRVIAFQILLPKQGGKSVTLRLARPAMLTAPPTPAPPRQ